MASNYRADLLTHPLIGISVMRSQTGVSASGERMAESGVQDQAEVSKIQRRWLPGKISFSLILAFTALVLAIVSLTLQIIQGHKLESRLRELEWSDLGSGQDSYLDSVEPSVGTIQFLRRGYTIEFTKVNYTPGGLSLYGFIGNPTQLWISSLTLEFSANKSRSVQRAKFLEESYHGRYFFLFEQSIGSAQTETIASLPPGRRQPFHVTIPNVKQTQEGFQLTVAFSGERYAYGL